MINIKACTVKLLKEHYQIEPQIGEMLFDDGLLQENFCKRTLIKEEYYNRIGTIKKIDIKNELANKYCVSLSYVEKIVLNHT
jgi:hypothetical protein